MREWALEHFAYVRWILSRFWRRSQKMSTVDAAKATWEEVDEKRRNLLKLAGLGTGAFLVGKFGTPFLNMVEGDAVVSDQLFGNFRVVESGKELQFLDLFGNEILVIDRDSF